MGIAPVGLPRCPSMPGDPMGSRRLQALLLGLVACAHSVCAYTSFAVLADLHVGENCTSPYEGEDDCYSVQHLLSAVKQLNAQRRAYNVSFVVVVGDMTSSAEPSQFAKAASILDTLEVPFFPMMGNHDVWTYSAKSDAKSPTGDQLFEQAFKTQLSH